MVQHIVSKFSLPKNLPVLFVAVGRSRGFTDPLRSHAQDGNQSSLNALLCHTLLHPHITQSTLSFSFYSLALLSLCAQEFCGSLLRERSHKGTGSGVQKKRPNIKDAPWCKSEKMWSPSSMESLMLEWESFLIFYTLGCNIKNTAH